MSLTTSIVNVLAYITILGISGFITIIAVILTTGKTNFMLTLTDNAIVLLSITGLSKLIAFIGLRIIRNIIAGKKNYYTKKAITFMGYISLFVILCLLFFVINLMLVSDIYIKENIDIILFLSLVQLLASPICYIAFLSYHIELKEKEKMVDFLEKKNQQQFLLYSIKIENNEKIRELYHDLKRHTLYLLHCLEKEKYEKGITYIKDFLAEIISNAEVNTTGSDILDFLLMELKERCEREQVDLSICIDFSKCSLKDIDVSTLFGNLLDNAFETSMRVNDVQKRFISINGNHIETYYAIKVVNFVDSRDIEDAKKLKTHKINIEHHGLGIQSIDRVISKYNGTRKITVEQNHFTFYIMLPYQDK